MGKHAVELAAAIRSWLERDQAASDVNAYFADPDHAGDHRAGFTGRYFERLGGGGDRPAIRNQVTAEDLIAVQTLSITVRSEVALAILEGDLGRQLNQYLRDMPHDVALGDADARRHLVDDAAASRAWALLNGQWGVGFVTAGKLLARKRPHLIPVYDDVVRCALHAPKHPWLTLNDVFLDEQTGIRTRLRDLRASSHVPAEVSDLRLLDVVVWQGHRRRHQRKLCPALSAPRAD